MNKIKRTYFHCEDLEEAPMWGNIKPTDQDLFIDRSADLMREPDSFKLACREVLAKWPNSSIHNLSARGMNRMAWLGHAACYLSHESVEFTTRLGWRCLDQDEQKEANKVANEIIEEFEECQKLD